MCTVLLPPGGYTIAVKYILSDHKPQRSQRQMTQTLTPFNGCHGIVDLNMKHGKTFKGMDLIQKKTGLWQYRLISGIWEY